MSKTNTQHSTATSLMSIDDFAYELGCATRLIRENSLPFHNAYESGTPVQQRDLRVRWMGNHIRGSLNVTLTQAEAIRDAGKGGKVTPTHKAAIDKAYSDFRYHVVRPVKGADKADSDSIVVPAHIAKLAAALAEACNEYESARKLASTAVANAFAK